VLDERRNDVPQDRPERLAYWFCRLNGCATIENFVVHPDEGGSQRTDIDLLAVRFPHRQELLTSSRPMVDHSVFMQFPNRVQVVFVEVKSGNRPCSLNGPWTLPERENMHRVLYAVGAIPSAFVPEAATRLYRGRLFENDALAVRLLAIGRQTSSKPEMAPPVAQITWEGVLTFIYERLRDYREVKAHHPQWDSMARNLYRDATNRCEDLSAFVRLWMQRIGVDPTETWPA
jgi:hypothetical protein